jgi:hypothetical protein
LSYTRRATQCGPPPVPLARRISRGPGRGHVPRRRRRRRRGPVEDDPDDLATRELEPVRVGARRLVANVVADAQALAAQRGVAVKHDKARPGRSGPRQAPCREEGVPVRTHTAREPRANRVIRLSVGESGRGDSNPRPPAPKAGALPLRHSPSVAPAMLLATPGRARRSKRAARTWPAPMIGPEAVRR